MILLFEQKLILCNIIKHFFFLSIILIKSCPLAEEVMKNKMGPSVEPCGTPFFGLHLLKSYEGLREVIKIYKN